MNDAEELEQSIAELNTRHAAEYIGLTWVGALYSAEGKFIYGTVREGVGELEQFMPLHDNSDAYKLACKGNLWHSDDVAQAYNHEAYAKDPEGEMRRVLVLAAATRQRRKLDGLGKKKTMTIGNAGEIS